MKKARGLLCLLLCMSFLLLVLTKQLQQIFPCPPFPFPSSPSLPPLPFLPFPSSPSPCFPMSQIMMSLKCQRFFISKSTCKDTHQKGYKWEQGFIVFSSYLWQSRCSRAPSQNKSSHSRTADDRHSQMGENSLLLWTEMRWGSPGMAGLRLLPGKRHLQRQSQKAVMKPGRQDLVALSLGNRVDKELFVGQKRELLRALSRGWLWRRIPLGNALGDCACAEMRSAPVARSRAPWGAPGELPWSSLQRLSRAVCPAGQDGQQSLGLTWASPSSFSVPVFCALPSVLFFLALPLLVPGLFSLPFSWGFGFLEGACKAFHGAVGLDRSRRHELDS